MNKDNNLNNNNNDNDPSFNGQIKALNEAVKGQYIRPMDDTDRKFEQELLKLLDKYNISNICIVTESFAITRVDDENPSYQVMCAVSDHRRYIEDNYDAFYAMNPNRRDEILKHLDGIPHLLIDNDNYRNFVKNNRPGPSNKGKGNNGGLFRN